MKIKLCLNVIVALAGLAISTDAYAQALHTPAAGSAERKAIMNALRPPVVSFLHMPVIFNVRILRSQSGWAMVDALPEMPSGAPINWNKTQWASEWRHGIWGGGVDALLRMRHGKWAVVTYAIGASDVEWTEWPRKFGCPRAICGPLSPPRARRAHALDDDTLRK